MRDSKKKDPFAYRDGGGSFTIGEDGDDAISGFVKANDQLYILSRKGISILIMADTTDPERANPSIPHNKQKVLSYGSDSPFVCRILLQASELFQNQHLSNHINCEKALNHSFQLLKFCASMQDTLSSYNQKELEIRESYLGKTDEDGSLKMPHIENLDRQIKMFVSDANSAFSELMYIVKIFYPKIANKGWEKQLSNSITTIQGGNSPAVLFSKEVGPFITQVRNLRNAIEHPKPTEKVKCSNYHLTKGGSVSSPSLELIHPDTPFSEMPIKDFMENTFEGVVFIFENLLAHLCNLHTVPFGNAKCTVGRIPEKGRLDTNKHMQFKYVIHWIN
jgi:hypothetical protein